MPQKSGALGRRRVTGTNGDAKRIVLEPKAPRSVADTNQRSLQVALDVYSEGLDRRDIEDAATLCFLRRRRKHEPVDGPKKCSQRLACTGRREDQSRTTPSDSRPPEELRPRWSEKDGREPLSS